MLETTRNDRKVEAMCKGCNQTLLVFKSQINQRFTCKSCGYSSVLTNEVLLHSVPIFTRKQMVEEEPKKSLNHSFNFFRHGLDEPQKAILVNLQQNELDFVSKTKLTIGSKISFTLKDKKFIVSIQSVKALATANKVVSLYAINALFETVVAMTKTVRSPHYLIK